jgi:hypothetical protein
VNDDPSEVQPGHQRYRDQLSTTILELTHVTTGSRSSCRSCHHTAETFAYLMRAIGYSDGIVE